MENNDAVEQSAPVEKTATVEENAAAGRFSSAAYGSAAVEDNATVEPYAIVEGSARAGRWRRRPIQRITDGLTPGQYAVYQLMYEASVGGGNSPRLYNGGYADLRRLTGLSKRGIQNVIAELQTKQVISVHQKPGYHRSETTAYAVPDPETVLATWFARGWRFAWGKSKTITG